MVTLLGLVLASIYGGLVSWVGVRPGLFFFNTLVASFVILALFDPIRSRVEEWVVVNLFPERYELVRELEELRRREATIPEEPAEAEGAPSATPGPASALRQEVEALQAHVVALEIRLSRIEESLGLSSG